MIKEKQNVKNLIDSNSMNNQLTIHNLFVYTYSDKLDYSNKSWKRL